MELQQLKPFIGKNVKIILKNGFLFKNVYFKITDDGLVTFYDKFSEKLIIDPDFIKVLLLGREGK